MISEVFEKAYKQLNAAQKKAVDTIEGPVMVIAGPGTGKTQILTLRIANILLKTDTAPENILALTFTEAGTYAMRRRLVEVMGPRAYKVVIATFHGFCNNLINKYPERFSRIVGGALIAETDQIALVEQLLQKDVYMILRPYGNPAYYVRDILGAIRTCKREGVGAEEFFDITKKEHQAFAAVEDLYHEKGAHRGKMKGKYKDMEGKMEKNDALAGIYREYQEYLFATQHYDYEDMIMETVAALRGDEDFRLMLQEEYQYILADEHQDANNAQNTLLELLASYHETPNLFIVGDEKQAIYRFQGASLANFLYFKDKFPEVVQITLSENYRSTQEVLDSAHSVISHTSGDDALRAKLKSNRGGGSPIRIAVCGTKEEETTFVLREIRDLIESGTSPEEIAIFYRTNKDAESIVHMLEKTNVPFIVLSDQHLLEDDDIAGLLLFLSAVERLGDDMALGKALYLPYLGIDPVDAFRVTSAAYNMRIPLSRALEDEKFLADAKLKDPGSFTMLMHRLYQLNSVAKNKSLLEALDAIIGESGYISHMLSHPGSLEHMEKLDQFIQVAKRAVESHKRYQLADFLEHIRVLEEHGVLIKGGTHGTHRGVRLMTAHKSKGLEFDHVFILGVTDGHWGGRRSVRSFCTTLVDSPLSHQSSGEEDDERRLFYVALTRARITATISYPEEGEGSKELLPSQFIEEIDLGLRAYIDHDEIIQKSAPDPASMYAPKKNAGPSVNEQAYIHQRFLEQGLSVSALNNYLRCPWEYFFVNLVRIPQSYNKMQIYGTTVHDALKDLFDTWKERGEIPAESYLMDRFHYYLSRQPIAEAEYMELMEKGNASLPGFYRAYHSTWNPQVSCEYAVPGIHIEYEHGSEKITLLLKGKLDKVEYESDVNVNVVDYKTAKPKSRNVIEGKTKSSDGGYKRQLVFYKLLLDNMPDEPLHMVSGEIDFTEPDDKGAYRKERFEITKEEVVELEETVKRVAGEILDLSFWDKTCDDKDCTYCALHRLAEKRN